MMKKLYFIIGLGFPLFSYAQVGINTNTPKVTLDVTGNPTESILDGIIAPRITGNNLRAKTYGIDQNGAFVYVTLADTSPSGQTVDVTSTGYYYFDFNTVTNGKWVKFGSGTASTEPWKVQATSVSATGNTQNIYQQGKVAIGTTAADAVRTENLYTKGITYLDGINYTGNRASDFYLGSSTVFAQSYSKGVNSNTTDSKSRSYLMLESNVSTESKPIVELFSGNADDKVGSKITQWSNATQKSSGLAFIDFYAYSFNSNATNDGKNTYMGIDDIGVKIGLLKASDLSYDGYYGITANNGLNADAYYLPKTMPLAGQVLAFSSSVTTGNVTTTKTAWTNLLTINSNPANPANTFAATTATGGDFYAKDPNMGIILTSPNGSKFKITVNDDGSLNSTKVNAPSN